MRSQCSHWKIQKEKIKLQNSYMNWNQKLLETTKTKMNYTFGGIFEVSHQDYLQPYFSFQGICPNTRYMPRQKASAGQKEKAKYYGSMRLIWQIRSMKRFKHMFVFLTVLCWSIVEGELGSRQKASKRQNIPVSWCFGNKNQIEEYLPHTLSWSFLQGIY